LREPLNNIPGMIQEIIKDGNGLAFSKDFVELNHKDKRLLKEIILQNNISSFFLNFLNKNNITQIINKKFYNQCNLQQRRFQIHALEIIKEIHLINNIFTNGGLNPIYLKGIAVQKEYEDITLRPLIDIDILFSKAEILKAYKLLHSNNILRPEEPQFLNEANFDEFCKEFHHIQLFTRNNILIELHYRITSPRDFLFCPISDYFFKDNRIINFHGQRISIPSLENTIIHQLIHFSLNTSFKKLLKTLNDIQRINNNYKIDWPEIILKYDINKIRKCLCLSLEIINLNGVLIKDLEEMRLSYKKYFPNIKLIEEAQNRLFDTRKYISGELLYNSIVNPRSFLKILKKYLFPNTYSLIYRYKIHQANKFMLLKLYVMYFFELILKLRFLPFFIKSKLSANYNSYEIVNRWLNKN